MTSPTQPFRIAVERPDGVHYYVLKSKNVVLRGGREQPIQFFVREDAPQPQTGFEVVETLRQELPLEGQVLVARAMVNMLGYGPDEAARVAGSLKAEVEGLSAEQRAVVISQVREALEEQ